MRPHRPAMGVVLFGLGAGASAAIVAHEAVQGLTGLYAILLAVVALAGLGFVGDAIRRWRVEFQVTALLVAITVAFIYWVAWFTGTAQITSDLRVSGMLSGQEILKIRAGALAVLLIMVAVLSWLGYRERVTPNS